MNRIFLLIIISVLTISINAQKIELDRIEDDGRRQLMCSDRKEKLDGVEYNFILKAFEKYNHIDWCLLVSSFSYIPENVSLLLKLGNDKVLYLNVNNRTVDEITMPSYSYLIGNIAYSAPQKTADYYTALFELKEEQLKDIEEYGILKIRISSRRSYNEKTWRKDKLGIFLVKSWHKMVERYATTKVKSIWDEF